MLEILQQVLNRNDLVFVNNHEFVRLEDLILHTVCDLLGRYDIDWIED